MNKQNEYVMYILVNNELKMSKGKIGAQCSHVACRVTRELENMQPKPNYYMNWILNNEPKIVLKADEKLMINIIRKYSNTGSNLWCKHIYDMGKTQIKPNSLTAIAFRPIIRSLVPQFIKGLKLL